MTDEEEQINGMDCLKKAFLLFLILKSHLTDHEKERMKLNDLLKENFE